VTARFLALDQASAFYLLDALEDRIASAAFDYHFSMKN
jgi:hypothetical protein